MDNLNYHDKKNAENMVKLRELMTTLPPFCREFFLGIKDTTSTRTRLAYAYDLRLFFEYLHENHPRFKNCDITEYEVKWLDEVKALDITEYLDYLSYYEKDDEAITNEERGKQSWRLFEASINSSSIQRLLRRIRLHWSLCPNFTRRK